MALTKLSVGRGIEIAVSDRKDEVISEAKALLMRDGKDLEDELKSRQKNIDDLTFTLSRTPLGDLSVTVEKIQRRG